MKIIQRYLKSLPSFVVLLSSFILISCGGGGNNNGGNNGGGITNSSSAFSSFSINGAKGLVNQSAKTITVTLPSGTSVTSLIATFVTTGSSVAVGVTPQVSGVTANNFTSPVAYVITASDSTSSTYNVTVKVSSSSAKALTSYSIAGVAGTVNETAKTISVGLPSGTAVN